MRNILKIIVYLFFPPYFVAYIIKLLNIINITTELSVFLALFLNLINLSIALLLFNLSKNKSNQLFFLLNLGGMGVRVLFLLFTFTLSLIFLEIDKYAFIFVFLFFYSVSILFEVKHFNSKKDDKKIQ